MSSALKISKWLFNISGTYMCGQLVRAKFKRSRITSCRFVITGHSKIGISRLSNVGLLLS